MTERLWPSLNRVSQVRTPPGGTGPRSLLRRRGVGVSVWYRAVAGGIAAGHERPVLVAVGPVPPLRWVVDESGGTERGGQDPPVGAGGGRDVREQVRH